MYRIILLLSCFLASSASFAKSFELKSPDGQITVAIQVAEKINYSVYGNNTLLLENNTLNLYLNSMVLGESPKLIGHKTVSIDRSFKPVVALKFAEIVDRCNSLRLDFKGGWAVEFRAYDDGVAYRFVTSFKNRIDVLGENFSINFPDNYTATMQQPERFQTGYEESYTTVETKDWKVADRMAVLPLFIDTHKGYKILISESDLTDYPCMFLKGSGNNGMKSTFPKATLAFKDAHDRGMLVTNESDYIASTSGTRGFPWRYFVIVKNDGQLIETTMTARLADKMAITDTSWIKPGQVCWDWWNGLSSYGPDVNFVTGVNTDTYKYNIDFASKYGIPYIILDEGWALTTRHPYTSSDKVDLQELIRYGNQKGVGVILWVTWLVVERNFDIFEKLSKWGVKGLKVDFMDMSDQWMVNYYERVAAEAAKHKMMVVFHGSFKPSGLEYKYPNILAYEGVRGMEQMGNCIPSNSVWLPFIRNAVGGMDYTLGAMISMQPEHYTGSHSPNAATIGTRAYQMALFVLFETGLQMLSDTPTMYYRNEECTQFMCSVPVTWDETRSLSSVAGKHSVVAKRKGDQWYIGAINGSNDMKGLSLEVSLDFLDRDKTYSMTSFEDGINAHNQAMDYRKKTSMVSSVSTVKIDMARNGGWAAVIKP